VKETLSIRTEVFKAFSLNLARHVPAKPAPPAKAGAAELAQIGFTLARISPVA
jgi:hypothetical protein